MTALEQTALTGSYVPLVTPFIGGDIDLAAYERLVDRQVAGGSRGVVVAGTTGEPGVLLPRERTDLPMLPASPEPAERLDAVLERAPLTGPVAV